MKCGDFQPNECFAPSASMPLKPISATNCPISSEYIKQELRNTLGSLPNRLLIFLERRFTSSTKHSGLLMEEKPWL